MRKVDANFSQELPNARNIHHVFTCGTKPNKWLVKHLHFGKIQCSGDLPLKQIRLLRNFRIRFQPWKINILNKEKHRPSKFQLIWQNLCRKHQQPLFWVQTIAKTTLSLKAHFYLKLYTICFQNFPSCTPLKKNFKEKTQLWEKK